MYRAAESSPYSAALRLVCPCVGLARWLSSYGHVFPALVEDAGLDPRTQVTVMAHNTL